MKSSQFFCNRNMQTSASKYVDNVTKLQTEGDAAACLRHTLKETEEGLCCVLDVSQILQLQEMIVSDFFNLVLLTEKLYMFKRLIHCPGSHRNTHTQSKTARSRNNENKHTSDSPQRLQVQKMNSLLCDQLVLLYKKEKYPATPIKPTETSCRRQQQLNVKPFCPSLCQTADRW